MPLYRLKEDEIRALGKKYVETLELWLRRIIDYELRKKFGVEYIHAKKNNSQEYLFSKSIRNEVDTRRKDESQRYSRPIDACSLETEICILTKEDLLRDCFKKYFKKDFPRCTSEMLRYMLLKIKDARNPLSHANSISVRQLEQIICYSNDIITAIKKYYEDKKNNMKQEFNVPKIIRMTDSFGNQFFRSEFVDFSASKEIIVKNKLYPGDKLKIEVDIDSTFPRDNYKITWESWGTPRIPRVEDLNMIEFTIEERHRGECLAIQCRITSNEDWHRYDGYDDLLVIRYKVLPIP